MIFSRKQRKYGDCGKWPYTVLLLLHTVHYIWKLGVVYPYLHTLYLSTSICLILDRNVACLLCMCINEQMTKKAMHILEIQLLPLLVPYLSSVLELPMYTHVSTNGPLYRQGCIDQHPHIPTFLLVNTKNGPFRPTPLQTNRAGLPAKKLSKHIYF